MENFLPSILFILTTALCIWIFFKASGNHFLALALPLTIAVLSAFAAKTGWVYPDTQKVSLLVVFPATSLLLILVFFISGKGRRAFSTFNLRYLTMLHVVRIPVEITLFLLFTKGLVPELMTFSGDNPDIISGITAPAALLLFFRKNRLRRTGLLIWNVACLILLFNILIRAVLSLPSPFQQLGFDQPNTAVFLFPYIWLPAVVVPLVLLAHLISIRQLLQKA